MAKGYTTGYRHVKSLEKEFNVTGTCIPSKHYMVDTSNKLKETMIYRKRKVFCNKYFVSVL